MKILTTHEDVGVVCIPNEDDDLGVCSRNCNEEHRGECISIIRTQLQVDSKCDNKQQDKY